MFTESMLRKHPALVRAFTGIPAEEFWEMLEKIETQLFGYEKGRHTRDGRERSIDAGLSLTKHWLSEPWRHCLICVYTPLSWSLRSCSD